MSKPKILIIEDEPSLIEILSYNLGHEGFDRGVRVDVEVRLRHLHLLHVFLEDGPALLGAQLADPNVFRAVAACEPDRALPESRAAANRSDVLVAQDQRPAP